MMSKLDLEVCVSEIDNICHLLHKIPKNKYDLVVKDERTFILKSKQRMATSEDREIDLMIQCLTHGNEVGGIFVTSELLRLIKSEIISPKLNIGISLGNIEALKNGTRFLESDLNRSFGLTEHRDHEQKLAKRLEEIYQNSFLLIDLHQTQGPCLEPFFISRFDPASFRLMRVISPVTNVVTYFEQNFGGDKMTTVNFQLSRGGMGFGIELGKKGRDNAQVEFGVSLMLKALSILEYRSFHRKFPDLPVNYEANVFAFDEAVKTKTGNFSLRPGFSNMTEVKKDTVIGDIDASPYVANCTGRMLFPVYLKEGEQGTINSDVFRLLRPVGSAQLREYLRV